MLPLILAVCHSLHMATTGANCIDEATECRFFVAGSLEVGRLIGQRVCGPLEARLSRWLLRCRDLTGSDDIDLTQEFLSQMLEVRRTSVTIVAGTLQQAGLIRYKRGHVRVLDVEGLRESARECYETVKAHSDRLLGGKTVA